MIRTVAVLLATATLVAAVDLAQEALSAGAGVLAHNRSALYMVGLAAVSVVWAVAVSLTRSVSLAFAGGFVLGGAVGNLSALALWPAGVPDPLVARGIAFNLADVAALLGFALLVPTTVVFAIRNRARLFEPVRIS